MPGRARRCPQPHRAVGAGRRQDRPRRAEATAVDGVARAGQQRLTSNGVAGSAHIPQPDGLRGPGGRERPPVRAEGHREQRAPAPAGISGGPAGTGAPGRATFHSRTVPSAAATASRCRRSGLRAMACTTPCESLSRVAAGVPDDSSRLPRAARGAGRAVGRQAELSGDRRILAAQLAGFHRQLARVGDELLGHGRRPALRERVSRQPDRRQHQHRQRRHQPGQPPGPAPLGLDGRLLVGGAGGQELAGSLAQAVAVVLHRGPVPGDGQLPAAQQRCAVVPGVGPGPGRVG